MNEIYRDPTEGATAKRAELLRRRRDELATMPHAVRRVVVARTARIAASVAIAVVGGMLIVSAWWPGATSWLLELLPGADDALRATMLGAMWVAGIGAWWIARARVEHRFAVTMSRFVLAGDDLHTDLERLDHERPDAAAKQMANRLEVPSAMLPVLAAAMLLPATAMYLAEAWSHAGWPLLLFLELRLSQEASSTTVIAILGVAAALVMTRRSARLPGVAIVARPVAGLAAAVALFGGLAQSHTLTWVALAVAVIAGPIAYMSRRLHRERLLIDAIDPAAGSELFTVRGALRQARASLGTMLTAGGSVRRALVARRKLVVGTVVLGGIAIVGGHHLMQPVADRPPPTLHRGEHAPARRLESAGLGASETGDFVDHLENGAIVVTTTLGDQPLDIGLSSFAAIPDGWGARIHLRVTGASGLPVRATMFPEDPAMFAIPITELGDVFVANACGETRPVRLHIEPLPPGTPARSVTFEVAPVLRVAQCPYDLGRLELDAVDDAQD